MKLQLLKYLKCPKCNLDFNLKIIKEAQEIEEGELICPGCNKTYLIKDYIPRLVETDDYVKSFSFEWTLYRETQLDSFSGTNESEEVFKTKTGFDLKELNGKIILDAGCGAGRFTEIAAKYKGEVIGVDLSFSVDSAFKNLGFKKNIHIIQADIFNLPFKEEIFDYIFSIGVLHHTPNPKEAFKQLVKFLKKNGEIAIWVYSNEGLGTKIINKISNFYRLFTIHLPSKLLYYLSYLSVPLYYLKKIKIIGKLFLFLLPTSMHPNSQWRILDTFDWYSPRYQSKHTFDEVTSWFKEASFKKIKKLDAPISIKGIKQ